MTHLRPGGQADGWLGMPMAGDWRESQPPVPVNAGVKLPGDGARLLVCGALDHWRTQWLADTAARQAACVGVLDPFCPATLLAVIDELEFNALQVQPWQLQAVLQLPQAERQAFTGSSLEQVGVGGARCPAWLRDHIEGWWQVGLQEHYSRRGFPAVVALERPDSLAVVDASGEPLPLCHIGRIEFLTAAPPDAVPDWGVINESRRLELVGREDTLLELPAGRISPVEAEQVLEMHPAVMAARLVKVPGDTAQFMAAVELWPATADTKLSSPPSPVLELALLDSCQDMLSSIKCPQGVAFVEGLPRLEGGRVNDDQLRILIGLAD